MASFESIGSLQFRLSKYLLLFERPLLAETTATLCVWVANHLKLRRLPLDSWMRDNSDLKDFTVDLFISKAASKVSSESRVGRLKALALNFFLISKACEHSSLRKLALLTMQRAGSTWQIILLFVYLPFSSWRWHYKSVAPASSVSQQITSQSEYFFRSSHKAFESKLSKSWDFKS